VTGRVRVCAQCGGANDSSVAHVVKETLVTDRRQELSTLNLVVIDAYLHDNVDYFCVIYDITKPTDIDLFKQGTTLSIR